MKACPKPFCHFMVTDPDYLVLHELLAHSSLPALTIKSLVEQISVQLSSGHSATITLELKGKNTMIAEDVNANGSAGNDQPENQGGVMRETAPKKPRLISNSRLGQGDILKVSFSRGGVRFIVGVVFWVLEWVYHGSFIVAILVTTSNAYRKTFRRPYYSVSFQL